MAKVAIKSEKLSPFGGIFPIMEQFDSKLSSVIDSTLGMRCRLYGYQYSEIIRSLMSETYDFNTADKLNTLLLNCLLSTGQLKEGEGYDVDFDHQFIEAEKYDAKPTYKKFLGYRPGVAVIGDLIVGIENSDGNTNVRFHQKDTLKRFFERFLKGLNRTSLLSTVSELIAARVLKR